MVVLEKVGIWSAARLGAVVLGGAGLVLSASLALLLVFGVEMEGGFQGVESEVLTTVLLLLGPPFYGLGLGALGCALSALLYNLAARWVGGIELQLAAVRQKARRAPSPTVFAEPGASR